MEQSRVISGSRQRRIRVFVVDDHPIILDALQLLIEASSKAKLVGSASNGRMALQTVEGVNPDVVLMDILMRGLDGAQTTRLMLSKMPDLKILAYTALSDREKVVEMMKAGARGYFLKDQPPGDLVPAIETVFQGEIYMAPTLRHIRIGNVPYAAGPPSELASLTEAELRVLAFIADGFSNQETAEHLKLSTRTIEKHRENIMLKLDIRNVAELTKFAIRHGISGID